MCPLGIWSHVCSFEDSIRSSIPSFWSFFSPASQNPREHACLLIAGLATHCWQFVSVLHFFSSEPTMAGIHSVHSHMVAHCVAEKQTPSLSKLFDGYFHFFSPTLSRQSPVSPTSRRQWGLCCLPTTQRATGTTSTAFGWSSPSPAPGFIWHSTTLTWSLPMISSLLRMGTSQGAWWWAVSPALRSPRTSRPTATCCSWSFRRIIRCPAEDSTSPTAVRAR